MDKFQLAVKAIFFRYLCVFVLISAPFSSPERREAKGKLLMFLASGVVVTWEPSNNMQLFLCYGAFLSILSAVRWQAGNVSLPVRWFKVFISILF